MGKKNSPCWGGRNFGNAPIFWNFWGRVHVKKEEVELLLSVGGDGTFLDSVIYVKDSGVPVLGGK